MAGKRRGRAVGFAALLGTLAVAAVASSENPAELTPGQTIRVTPPESIRVPGVVTVLHDGTVESRWPVAREGNRILTIRSERKTLCVPMPDTTVAGELVAADGETIVIRRNEEPKTLSIPREAVATIEVRRHRGHAGLGALVGGVAGFALAYLAVKNCTGEWGCGDATVAALMGGVFAVPGAVAGGVVGNAVAGERWEPVSSERVRIAIAPRRAGAAAIVAVGF